MLKRIISILLAISAGATTLPCLAAETDNAGENKNLLINSSFETRATNSKRYTGTGAQDWPFLSNWNIDGYVASVDSTVSRSGSTSMKLGGTVSGVRVAVAQTVKGLDPDKYYKISGYIKCVDYLPSTINQATGPAFRVNPVNTSSYYYTDTIVKPKVSNTVDWTYVENVFCPGTADIRVDCFFPEAEGYAYYDDVQLTEYIPYTSVEITEKLVNINAGETMQLTAKAYPEKDVKPEVLWKSSNTDVVKVDENGVITASAINNGEAVISAVVTENICISSTSGKKMEAVPVEGLCKVRVSGGKIHGITKSIKLDKKSASLVKNDDTLQLKVYSVPSKPENCKILWASSDDNVAVVRDGFVVPKGAGTAYITATASDNENAVDYCVVNVSENEIKEETASEFSENINTDFDEKVKASGYPNLLFSFEDIAHIRNKAKTGHTALTFKKMEQSADKYLKTGADTHATNATGGRNLHFNVTNLALTGYIKRDMRYIDKAISVLVASAEKYTAKDYKNMNGDIALGDAAHAYAVGYDWLYPFMNDEQKQKIIDILYDLCDTIHGLGHTTELPGVSSNHNSVACGGMGLAAFVLGDKPELVELAREQVAAYYETSTDSTGFNGEGISYYSYGALGAHTFAEAYLRKYPGQDLIEKHSDSKAFLNMLVNYTKPGAGGYVTLGDASGEIHPAGGIVYLISKYRDENALWAYLQLTGKDGDGSYGLGSHMHGATAAYILIWADNTIVPKNPAESDKPLNSSYEWEYETYRDGWGELDTLVTFTSGYTPHRGHNHRDENTFTFYSRGEEFAIDPGYSPSETLSHNALMIDGVGQAVPGAVYNIHGKIIEKREFDNASYVVGDATDTYPKRLGAKSIQRRMLFSRGEVPYLLVFDDIKKETDAQSVFSWLVQTTKKNKIVTDGQSAKIIGSNRGAVMKISFPFTEDVILRTDTFERRRVPGGQGYYVASNECSTLEAVTFGGKDTRIVSLLSATDYEEEAPIVTVEGDEFNGVIRVKFSSGTEDVITIKGNDIDFNRTNGGEGFVPTKHTAPDMNVLNSLPVAPLTIEINGKLQDFDNSIDIINGKTYVNEKEFTDKIFANSELSEDVAEILAGLNADEMTAVRDICTKIGAATRWNADARHIMVQTPVPVNKVVGPNMAYAEMSGSKIKVIGIEGEISDPQNTPPGAIDGNLATNYALEGNEGVPVVLELDNVYTVSGLAIALSQGDKRVNRFNIEISEDKENWTKVMSCESSGTTAEFEGYAFIEKKAKYIKIVGFGNTSNNWNTFREIEVYGK